MAKLSQEDIQLLEREVQNYLNQQNQTSPGLTLTEPEPEKDSPGFLGNTYRTLVGAGRDVAQGTLDVADYLSRNLPGSNVGITFGDNPNTLEKESGIRFTNKLDPNNKFRFNEIKEPDYFGGSFLRDLTQFIIPFSRVNKALSINKPLSTVGKGGVAKDVANRLLVPGYNRGGKGALNVLDRTAANTLRYGTTGAIAENIAFSPYEERLSNLVQQYPSLQNPITEYLQADPRDTETEARFKMALEGAGIGIPIDAVMGLFGRIRARGNEKRNEALAKENDALKESVKEDVPTNEEGFKTNDFVYTPGIDDPDSFINRTAKPSQADEIVEQYRLNNDQPVTQDARGNRIPKVRVNTETLRNQLRHEPISEDDIDFNKWLEIGGQGSYEKDFKKLIEKTVTTFGTVNPDYAARRNFIANGLADIKLKAERDYSNWVKKGRKTSVTTSFDTDAKQSYLQYPKKPKTKKSVREWARSTKPFTYDQIKAGEIGDTLGLNDKRGRPSMAYVQPTDKTTKLSRKYATKFQKENFANRPSELPDFKELYEKMRDAGYFQPESGMRSATQDADFDYQEKITDAFINDRPHIDDIEKLKAYDEQVANIDQQRSILESYNINPDKYSSRELDAIFERIEREESFARSMDQDQSIDVIPPELRGVDDIGSPRPEAGGDIPIDIPPTRPPGDGDGFGPSDSIDPNRVANIRVDKYSFDGDDINVLAKQSIEDNQWMESRGRMKFGKDGELLRAEAKETGLTIDQFVNAGPRFKFTEPELMAAREMLGFLVKSTDATAKRLNKKLDAGDLQNQDRYTYQLLKMDLGAVASRLSGETAYAGRLLNSFKYNVEDMTPAQINRFRNEIIDSRKDTALDIDAQIKNDANLNLNQVEQNAKALYSPDILDMVQEYWINSLLSGPATHLVNISSNSLTALLRPLETYTGATASKLMRQKDGLSFSKANGRAFATVYGLKDALATGIRAFAKPESIVDPRTKLELTRQRSINTPAVIKGYDLIGDTIRLPGRSLVAEDTFFKQLSYNQEVYGQAFDIVAKKGIKNPVQFLKEVNVLVKKHRDNPNADVLGKDFEDIARNVTHYQTFTKDLGKGGQKLQKILSDDIGKWGRFVMPFVRTPVNIVKYAGERTPLGFLSKNVRTELAAGGERAAMQLAKISFGTGAMMMAYNYAADGLISGSGPKDKAEWRSWYARGNRPYAINMPNEDGTVTAYVYHRLEPLGILLGVSADLYEINKYMEENPELDINENLLIRYATMGLQSASANITDKTFFRGVSEIAKAFEDPNRWMSRYVNQQISSFNPTLFRNIAQVRDPFIRDTIALSDRINSESLFSNPDEAGVPIKRNIFGEKRRRDNEGLSALSPVKTSVIGDKELEALADANFYPGPMRREIAGIKLTPRQYEYMLNKLDKGSLIQGGRALPPLRSVIKTLISNNNFNDLPPLAKRKAFQQAFQTYRDAIRETTLVEFISPKSPMYSERFTKKYKEESESLE